MANEMLEIPMFMTVKLEKFDGDPPRFRNWNEVPLWERMKAKFTGEILVKEPVEIIERTYCLTAEEAKQFAKIQEERKNGIT